MHQIAAAISSATSLCRVETSMPSLTRQTLRNSLSTCTLMVGCFSRMPSAIAIFASSYGRDRCDTGAFGECDERGVGIVAGQVCDHSFDNASLTTAQHAHNHWMV